MARARLKLYQFWQARLTPSGSAPLTVPAYRLYARVSVEPAGRVQAALVDTGSAYTVVPPAVWLREDGTPAPDVEVDLFPEPPVLPTLDAGGRRYSYRWGRVEMALHDADDPAIAFPPVTVIAQFCVTRTLTDAERAAPPDRRRPDLPHILLGLSSGVFDERYVVLKPGPTEADCEAWAQDTPPAAG